MPYPNINDTRFDRTITLRDAHRVMYRMVEAHFQRGEMSTGDPATLGDYLDAAAAVLGQEAEREAVSQTGDAPGR